MADVMVKPPVEPMYVGDGVYASFDGYQIWLHLDRHDSRPVVALNPETMASLNTYAKRVGVV